MHNPEIFFYLWDKLKDPNNPPTITKTKNKPRYLPDACYLEADPWSG